MKRPDEREDFHDWADDRANQGAAVVYVLAFAAVVVAAGVAKLVGWV